MIFGIYALKISETAEHLRNMGFRVVDDGLIPSKHLN